MTNKSFRDYINLIESAQRENVTDESRIQEETTQYYNLGEWKRDAKKLKMFIRVGQMAGTKGVKIYEAETEDRKSGGRFFSGPGWNYGHLTVVNDTIEETSPEAIAKINELTRRP
jgi:hypothetical protein